MSEGLTAVGLVARLGGRRVLDGASCTVRPGTVTALIGPSGSGKSTLLRSLVRLVALEAGAVALDGVDVEALDPRALRRRVGLVAQTPVMLEGTVAANLRYGVPALDTAEADAALAAAGLDASFGDRDARALSGGERARVALARALTRGPEVLLLDEPTAALDAHAGERVGRTLRRLADEGLGICVATHDLAFADAWTDRREALG